MPMLAPTKPKTMYVTKRLVKYADSSIGFPLSLMNSAAGVVGVLMVFESREQAEVVHGIGVEMFEIEFCDP